MRTTKEERTRLRRWAQTLAEPSLLRALDDLDEAVALLREYQKWQSNDDDWYALDERARAFLEERGEE